MTSEDRHELRKTLKLLKLENVKLKKRLRLSTRIRTLNRTRLGEEIRRLNSVLEALWSGVSESARVEEPVTSNCDGIDGDGVGAYKYFCDRCQFRAKKKTQLIVHSKRHRGLKEHSCDVCQKSFVTKYELKAHIGKHSKENVYRCGECEYTSYRADLLINHSKTHVEFKMLKCLICDFKTDKKTKLLIHNESHDTTLSECVACKLAVNFEEADKNLQKSSCETENRTTENNFLGHTCSKPWTCETCNRSKKESLNKHIRTHTGERPFTCDTCNYSAATKHTLVVHKRKHTGDKPFVCDYCSFRCSTSRYLKIHLNKHLGIKPFVCDKCDYKSIDSCKLSAHLKIHHSDDKPFVCDKCSFRTKLRAQLKRHMTTHGLRPFICSYCAKKFTTKHALVEHEGTHVGNQPFECTICKTKNKFTLETTYKRHLNTHRLKFSCGVCDYKAAFAKDLKRHSKVHSNVSYRPRKRFEKILQCNFCQFRCVQQASLVKHKHLKHTRNPLEETTSHGKEEIPVPVRASDSVPIDVQDTTTIPSQAQEPSHGHIILNIPKTHYFQGDVQMDQFRSQVQPFSVCYANPFGVQSMQINQFDKPDFVEMRNQNVYSVNSDGGENVCIVTDPNGDHSTHNTVDSKNQEFVYSINYYRQ